MYNELVRETVRNKIVTSLQESEEDTILLFLGSGKYYQLVGLELLRALNLNDTTCIYITTNKPAFSLLKSFEKEGINADKIFFIDTVSVLSNIKFGKHKAVSVEASNLTGLAIAFSEMIHSISGKKAVIFDSLTTLAVYNSLNAVERFAQFLCLKIKETSSQGFLVLLMEDARAELKNSLVQFVDQVIEV